MNNMYLGVKEVKPLDGYKLLLMFENDEERIFDMNPFLDKGVFSDLRDVEIFNTVHVSFDTVEWGNGADLCPELLYRDSHSV
jgi:hypothetical protein